jgi:hypothetical protein
MKYFPKYITEDFYEFYSEKPIGIFEEEMKVLFLKTQGWDFSVNLCGKFYSNKEFEVTPKWQLTQIRIFGSLERDVAYIRGRLLQSESSPSRTIIIFSVRPNLIFKFFFLAFPIFAFLGVFFNWDTSKRIESILVGSVFIVIVPIVMCLFGYYAKQNLKNRFVEYFGLIPSLPLAPRSRKFSAA